MKDNRNVSMLLIIFGLLVLSVVCWILINPAKPPTPNYTNTPTATEVFTNTPKPTFTQTSVPTFTATVVPATYTPKPTYTPTKENTVFPTLTFTSTPTKDYRWMNCFGEVMEYPRYSWHSCKVIKEDRDHKNQVGRLKRFR